MTTELRFCLYNSLPLITNLLRLRAAFHCANIRSHLGEIVTTEESATDRNEMTGMVIETDVVVRDPQRAAIAAPAGTTMWTAIPAVAIFGSGSVKTDTETVVVGVIGAQTGSGIVNEAIALVEMHAETMIDHRAVIVIAIIRKMIDGEAKEGTAALAAAALVDGLVVPRKEEGRVPVHPPKRGSRPPT
jgi:hypothetical protein